MAVTAHTASEYPHLAKVLFHSPSGDVPQLHIALRILGQDVTPVSEHSRVYQRGDTTGLTAGLLLLGLQPCNPSSTRLGPGKLTA